MVRRFILIDQTVKSPGGHHYEFSQRILDAARQKGYTTLLLANKQYRGDVDHNVRGVFSQTFWDNYRYYYSSEATRPDLPEYIDHISKFLTKIRLRLNSTWLATTRRLISSHLGLALARARHHSFRDILLRSHLPDDLSYVGSSRWLLVLARILHVTGPYFNEFRTFVVRLRPMRFLVGIVVLTVSPFLVFFWLLQRSLRRDPAVCFAKELVGALGPDDLSNAVIFVPNATPAETEGLIAISQAHHAAADANWALLYRRPVFSGYPGTYKEQMESTRRYRVELARVKAFAPNVKVKFYTDTDELTEQYNLLGVFPFTTLPVPVDPQPSSIAGLSAPLTLGYLGDARDEKGFQYLPKIAEAFAVQPCNARSVRFYLQANFNVAKGEPGSRYARFLLQQYEPEYVKLLYGPFDSAEYKGLLKSMDIVLIPYSAENYSARSSGVLMEAVSLGLPVLVPACSWMAGILGCGLNSPNI